MWALHWTVDGGVPQRNVPALIVLFSCISPLAGQQSIIYFLCVTSIKVQLQDKWTSYVYKITQQNEQWIYLVTLFFVLSGQSISILLKTFLKPLSINLQNNEQVEKDI